MKPTERRQQESRDAWLRGAAFVLLTSLALAVLMFVTILRTVPAQLPDPPAQKPTPATSRWHF